MLLDAKISLESYVEMERCLIRQVNIDADPLLHSIMEKQC